jgi:hypothetical protein
MMRENIQHGARHRAPVRRTLLRALIGTSTAFAGATAIAVGLSGGSLALWTDGQATPAGTVTSGTIGLSITQSFNSTLWSNRLVGETVRQQFTMTNTGDVAMTLSAAATSSAAGFEVRVVRATCGATALTGASATVTPTALGTLSVGSTATFCLELAVVSGASAATSTSFSLNVTGTQS